MSQAIQTTNPIERALMVGDLSLLTDEQRLSYYMQVCETVGLNPLTKPFEYIYLNKKLVLYATKACSEQLRRRDTISIRITSRDLLGDVYVVTADAATPDGRTDSSTGAIVVKGLSGEALANAYMKAETKAKRRVTLSICGLGMPDESEIDSIPGAQQFDDKPAASTPAPHVQPVLQAVSEPAAQIAPPVHQTEPSEWERVEAEANQLKGPAPEPAPPMCCGRPMFVSKFKDKRFKIEPYYCAGCKAKHGRAGEGVFPN